MSPMPAFALATLTPLALILLGLWQGGLWVLAALVGMTGLITLLDRLVRTTLPVTEGEEFPAANSLSVAIALAQLALIAAMVLALPGDRLRLAEKLALFVAAGSWLGQVGNSNAHELIHRGGRMLHGLGVLAFTSVLFGHHASAHPLVHHIHVATRADPNTARRGESLYRFIPRAWAGSFRAGWQVETARLARAGRAGWRHPYGAYLGGAAVLTGLAAWAGGLAGLAVFAGLALFAQMQLMMSDYVQHYGLTRATGPNGKPVPVGPRHSWNAGQPVSSALMLNAPRHSDHHSHPARPYPALRLPGAGDAPRLPRSLPVMATLALFPPLWRRVMDPLVAQWTSAEAAPLPPSFGQKYPGGPGAAPPGHQQDQRSD